MVLPKDFTENCCLKKYFLKSLFAGFGFIMLLEAPESINTFSPKLGIEINGNFGTLQIEFKSTILPRHLGKNFQDCRQNNY